MQIDTSDVEAMAGELEAAADRTLAAGEQVMQDAGERMRARAVALIGSQIRGVYLPHYADAITAEVIRAGGVLELLVGPETGRPQGGMGPGVELGSVNTAPKPHLFPAGDEIEPALAGQLADIGMGVLE